MDSQPSFQPYLDQLIAFGSSEMRKPDLLAAKAEYYRMTGEVFEDDKIFEQRMLSFLDYYLFDRKSPQSGKTPSEELCQERSQSAGGDPEGAFRSFTETIHGLFEVRKLGKGEIRLRELFSHKTYEVTERRQMAGLEKGDIIEARLIPFAGQLLFSGAFCYHPRAVSAAIRKEAKRRSKKEPHRRPEELTWECAKMALKADRYRQIPVEKIYEFQGKTI
jgi:hypothetical protein